MEAGKEVCLLLPADAILELTAAADGDDGYQENPHHGSRPPPPSKEQELRQKEQLADHEVSQTVSDIISAPIPTSLQPTSLYHHGGTNTAPAPNNYRLSEKGTLSTWSLSRPSSVVTDGGTIQSIRPGAVTVPGGRRGEDDGTDATIIVESSSRNNEQEEQEQAPRALAADANASVTTNNDGEIMVSANVVDPDHIQKKVEELLQIEREAARQTVLREMTSAELVSSKTETDPIAHNRRSMRAFVLILVCVFVVLVVGVSVGLTQRSNTDSGSSAAGALNTAPTNTPSSAPTSTECHFCYSSTSRGAELTRQVQNEVNWRIVVASQVPLITCQDAYEKSFELTIWDDRCSKLQADASFKCGCPDFPAAPPVPDDDSTACALCSSTEIPVPISATDSLETCQDASRWLPVIALNEAKATCDALRRQALGSSCKCVGIDSLVNEDYGNGQKDKETNNPCIDTLDSIVLAETTQVEDESIERTYTLCPNTIFQVGTAQLSNFGAVNAIVGGQLPIVVRSNARVLCGVDGSRANNCTIRDGSFGFLSNDYGVPGSIMQDQVHIQGISFVNVTIPVALYTITNITLEDCLFEEYHGSAIESIPWVLGPTPGTRNLRSVPPPRSFNNERKLQSEGDDSSFFHGTISILRSVFRNGIILPSEPRSIIYTRFPEDANAPDPSIGTRVSIDIKDSLFVNLIDAERGEETYANVLHGDGYGSISASNSCFWSAAPYYMGASFVLMRGTLENGFDVDSDLFLEGNYYRTDGSAVNQTSLCLVKANDTCLAYGSGSEDVCSSWMDEILQVDP